MGCTADSSNSAVFDTGRRKKSKERGIHAASRSKYLEMLKNLKTLGFIPLKRRKRRAPLRS